MIDFRYHVVSIVAVFLALTVGIVLGSSLFNEPLVTQLGNEVDKLADEKEALRAQISEMEQEAEYRDAFAEQVTPQLVDQRLVGQRVVVVTLPGADGDDVDALRDVLGASGATVSGEVALKQAYVESARAAELDRLVERLAPEGLTLPDSSTDDRAAAVLADALVTDSPGVSGLAYEPGAVALEELEDAGFLGMEGSPSERADLAVLVSGEPAAEDPDRYGEVAVALAKALDAEGNGTVVTGPPEAAEEHGTVKALRDDEKASDQVSTVDTVDTPAGRVSVVYALVAELRGEHGQYGRIGRTDGPLPDIDAEPRS